MTPGNSRDANAMAADAAALCTTCGLCCNGTLFQAVKVAASEAPRLERAGMPILRDPDPCFMLGCTMLADRACSIYEDRPATCRSFACALLKRLYTGEVSIDEAQRTVVTAWTLRGRVAAATTVGKSVAAALAEGAQDDWHSIADPDERRAAGVRFLDRTVLDTFLGRHFR